MSKSTRGLSLACSIFLAVAATACSDSKTKKKVPDAGGSGDDIGATGGMTGKGGATAMGGAGGKGTGGMMAMGGAGMGGAGMGGAGMGGAGMGGAGMGGMGMGGAMAMGGAKMPDGGPTRDGGTDAVSTPDSGPAAPVLETIVPLKSTWKYLDNGSDQKALWQAAAFNDTAWKSGPAELGYGDDDEATKVEFGPDATMKFVTTYFRHTFDLKEAAKAKSVLLQLVADDGAVVYLNGEEVWRLNMPVGDITSQTLSATSIGGADESLINEFDMLSGMKLKEGKNTIAVEIHQADVASSDISFDFALKVERAAKTSDGGTSDARVDASSAVTDGGAGDVPVSVAVDAPVDATSSVDAVSTSDAPTN